MRPLKHNNVVRRVHVIIPRPAQLATCTFLAERSGTPCISARMIENPRSCQNHNCALRKKTARADLKSVCHNIYQEGKTPECRQPNPTPTDNTPTTPPQANVITAPRDLEPKENPPPKSHNNGRCSRPPHSYRGSENRILGRRCSSILPNILAI